MEIVDISEVGDEETRSIELVNWAEKEERKRRHKMRKSSRSQREDNRRSKRLSHFGSQRSDFSAIYEE